MKNTSNEKRGRKLKADVFPELGSVLEQIFEVTKDFQDYRSIILLIKANQILKGGVYIIFFLMKGC